MENGVEPFYKGFTQVQAGRVKLETFNETGFKRIHFIRRAFLRVKDFPAGEYPAARGNFLGGTNTL